MKSSEEQMKFDKLKKRNEFLRSQCHFTITNLNHAIYADVCFKRDHTIALNFSPTFILENITLNKKILLFGVLFYEKKGNFSNLQCLWSIVHVTIYVILLIENLSFSPVM